MKKFIISVAFLAMISLIKANTLPQKSEEDMLKKCILSGQGTIKKIEKIKENWKEVKGERFLFSTDYQASFEVKALLKGKSKSQTWLLNYSIPGPNYGRYANRFSYVKVGGEYSVYGIKCGPDNGSGVAEIHIQTENELRLGTIRERKKREKEVESRRRDHLEKVRKALEAKEKAPPVTPESQ